MAATAPIEQLMQHIAAEYDNLSRQLKVIAQYIEKHRASLMLERISDIAAACGYASPSRFAARFRQHYGLSPRELRATL